MHDRGVQPANLRIERLLWVFAVLGVMLFVLLAMAPVRSHFPPWRKVQERYNALAAATGASPIEIRPYQVFHAEAQVVDRCVSCHLGQGVATALAGDRLFQEHPPIPHETGQFGCTPCHGGQGRALTEQDAHGQVRFWDEPMLERGFHQAGCGTCHTHFYSPSVDLGPKGEALFRRYDCVACHRIDGVGRGTGPDLSAAGLRGFREDWHALHLALAAKGDDLWKASYGPIPDGDVVALSEYLRGRVAAPALARGKALFLGMGCLGCHKVQGVGGDEALDLTREGLKSPWEMDFSGVRGPRTVASWQREHLEDPGRIVPGSRMPAPVLTPQEVEDLTLYLLSLRPRTVPLAWTPRDRFAGERMGIRGFASDGATLYRAFCSGCHGPRGEGRRYGNRDTVFPAIGNPDFLALASDDYLRATIAEGRPGRPMPAWKDGGLGAGDITAIIEHLRTIQEVTLDFEPLPDLPVGRADAGRPLYGTYCSGCHGATATEGEAPALRNDAFLRAADDRYIAATIWRGRTGTAMRHFGQASVSFPVLDLQEIADILAWLRAPRDEKGEAR